MKLLEWNTPFCMIKHLVLDELHNDGEDYLELILVEHKVVDKPYKATSDDPWEKIIDGTRPIEEVPNSRRWKVAFYTAVAFKRSSESYYFALFELERPVKGSCSFYIKPSPWLKEFDSAGILQDFHTETKHYAIFTEHSTIEVIAWEDPVITEIM